MEIRVKDRQTLLDVAVQVLGSAEGVFALCEHNGLNVTDRLRDGQLLEWSLADVVNTRVRECYSLYGIAPATEIVAREQQELLTATAAWGIDCVIPPYIKPDSITTIGADRDNLTMRSERTVVVENVADQTYKRARRAAATCESVPSESGTTLARIFTDQFNDVFA